MKKETYIPLVGLVILLLSLVSYLLADLADLVPGVLTVKSPVTALGKRVEYQLSANTPLKYSDFGMAKGKPPTAAQVQPLINALRNRISTVAIDNESTPTNAHLGVIVMNSQTGGIIAGYNTEQPMIAASSTKILSAVTALRELGPDYRFETAVFQDGDKITLVAGGDIALGMGMSNPDIISGRAGLATLAQNTAQKLKAQGMKTVAVGFDNSLFGDSRPLPAWVADEVTTYTINPTAIAINSGLVPGGGAYDYYKNPSQIALRWFTSKLTEEGITISHVDAVTEKSLEKQIFPVGGAISKDAKAKKIASVKGAELWELIYNTIKKSDNAMADSICRAATIKAGLPGSFANQVKTVKNNLEKLDIKTNGLQIQDCSGLSSQGKVAPALLANTILAILKKDNAHLHSLYSALPRSGFDGTLRLRMAKAPAVGNIWAKTGRLSQANSLSGFVKTKSGALLVVVAISDSYKPEFGETIREQLDEFMTSLAGL